MSIHNVLAAACRAVGASTADFEAEGKPELDDPRYDELALWIAEQAAPKLSKTQRAEVTRFAKKQKPRLKFDEDATDLSDTDVIVSGLHMYAVKGARRAACAAARLLGPSFLDALAKELWRLDAITLVEKQKLRKKSADIRESLWRGGAGARITHHIVRLGGDGYGLIAKVRGKWTWFEGPRDEMLATVPDALMESAVQAVAGASRPRTAKRQAASSTAAILLLDQKLTDVAMGSDGTAYAMTKRELGTMKPGETTFTWSSAKPPKLAAPSTKRVAKWASNVVTIYEGGKELASVKLDSGKIDQALFVDDGRLLVRYHGGMRVAVIDRDGKLTHRIEGRRLGTKGSLVRFLFPLARGAVLAFAPYPRGETVLVDVDSQPIARWSLGTLWVGGHTRFAEGGGRFILAHDHDVQRVLVV